MQAYDPATLPAADSATATGAALGRAIVVTSGKGGVGKTTTTANVGAALAAFGKRVALVDADVGLRNLDIVLGLESRVKFHVLDVLEEKATLDEALVRDKRATKISRCSRPRRRAKKKTSIRRDGRADRTACASASISSSSIVPRASRWASRTRSRAR